jgi:Tfp pilus assembly protein PilP
MRLSLAIASLLLVTACGQSNQEQLQEAANQSDPAAAAVLNGAAENGMDPQQALEQAGQAAAGNAAANGQDGVVEQARPNSAQNPNPAQPGQPPEKVTTNGQ